ncbi:MAG: GNAT family N-acetyltransferase [Thermodesulfobacteriota bacterium]|nr:GNAT family N-acetyltransferase [Thermodesulfobacteriota bacterium]
MKKIRRRALAGLTHGMTTRMIDLIMEPSEVDVMVKIISAKTTTHIDTVRRLFKEYENFLDVDLCFQDFKKELIGLPGKYAPPQGALLLALVDEEIAGCVAVCRFKTNICEMKRLYVRPLFRGKKIGRMLAEEIISTAKMRGYATMLLDTLTHLKEAMALYQSLGFKKREPYYHNPLPGVIYWELDLKA